MTFSNDRTDNEHKKFLDVGSDSDLSPKVATRVNDATIATNRLAVSAEAVSFAAGVAGTSGVVTLDKAPIYNVDGGKLGALGDTSFGWVTGTVLTTEVRYNPEQTDTVQLAALANGGFAIDYDLGRIRYKKATAGVADTCNYSTRQLNVDITGVEDIEIGAVEIKDATSDDRVNVITQDAAFGTATKGLAFFGKYQATPTTYTDNDAAPILLDANGRVVLSSDIEIGAIEIKDGTSDTRAIVKAGNTFAVGDSALGVADANVLAALAAVAIPTTLTGGSKTVAVSGTAEALGGALATKTIYVRAKSGNTGNVFVGDSSVDAVTSQQIILAANDSVSINIASRATVFVDVAVGGEGVDYLAMS